MLNPINAANQVATSYSSLTMTSREIADLVGARHDNVKRSIERLSSEASILLGGSPVISTPPLEEYLNSNNRISTQYRLGKRDTYVVVAQLSPEFTGQLVDRWQALEDIVAAQAPSISNISRSEVIDLLEKMFEYGGPRLEDFIESYLILTNRGTGQRTPQPEVLAQPAPPVRVNQVQDFSQQLLNPTALAVLTGSTPVRMNRILLDLGLQTRDAYGTYTPTVDAFGMYEETGNKLDRRGWRVATFKWKIEILQCIPERCFR